MISCKTIDMQDNFTNMQNYIINMQITLQTCKLRYKHANYVTNMQITLQTCTK